MPIYTKTGDKGKTSLLGGKRVSKSCLEMQVIGEVDELNAYLGVVVSLLKTPSPICESSESKVRTSTYFTERATQIYGRAYTGGGTEGGVLFEAKELIDFLQSIQRDLFKVGAELASLQSPLGDKINKIDNTRVGEMEAYIDKFWGELPELKNFILPGGSLAGAEIHRARTVCRRAERQLVDFAKNNPIRSEISMYINRLSDFLFALARFVNAKEGFEEIIV